jgi:hypothetical protein
VWELTLRDGSVDTVVCVSLLGGREGGEGEGQGQGEQARVVAAADALKGFRRILLPGGMLSVSLTLAPCSSSSRFSVYLCY